MAMMKKLTSALVASSLVLGLVGTAGATTPDKVEFAAGRMAALGLVQGKGGPDLALGDSITRAELVTVIVRAFGHDSTARYLTGVNTFPDTANHWASGYVTMAHKLITERSNGTEVVGYPDGTFKPDGQVTTAEAIAFLMKFTGAPKDNSLPYPDNYLQGAVNAGLITTEDLDNIEGIKNAPATRGLAFYLADSAFSGYKLAEGNTVYRTFVDSIGPELSITTQVAGPTLDSKITVTGTVSDAQLVFVGTPDNGAAINNGTFSIDVDLAMGENNIVVTAVDLVGNITEKTLKVTRTAGPAAAIAAEDITVAAGQTVDVAASVVDEVGNPLEGYEITGESAVGTYADGKFTAGEKAGEGVLTLKSGNFTKEVKVTVVAGPLAKVITEAPVAAGQPVKLIGADAYGNPIPGVTFSENSDKSWIDGEYFIAAEEGVYTVTGTLGDVTVESVIGTYGEIEELVVEGPESIVANGKTEISVTVKAVDKNGLLVADFNGYVEYESGDLDTDNAVVKMENGVATFTFTAEESLADYDAEAVFKLFEKYSDVGTSSKAVAEGEYSVYGEERVATSIELDAPDYLVINHDIDCEITVKVLDQASVEIEDSDEYEFEVSIEGPALLDDNEEAEGTFDLVNGEGFKIIPDGDETGRVTITVKSDELKAATAILQAASAGKAHTTEITVDDATVKVGDPASELSKADGNYAELTIQVVDRKGVPTVDEDVKNIDLEFSGLTKHGTLYYGYYDPAAKAWVHVNADDETDVDDALKAGETITVPVSGVNGKAVVRVATELAQSIKVVASHEDLDDSAAADIAFEAGSAHHIAVKSSTMYYLEENRSGIVAVVQLYDAFNNPVAKKGIDVDLDLTVANKGTAKVNGDDSAEQTYATDKNGQIILNIDLPKNADGLTINMTPAGITDTSTISLELVESSDDLVVASARLAILNKDGATTNTIRAGEKITLEVTLKDNEGNLYDLPAGLTLDDQFKVTTNADIDTGALTWTRQSEGVYTADLSASALTELNELGKVTFDVEILPVVDEVVAQKAVTAKAGDPVKLAFQYDGSEINSIAIESGKRKTVNFTLIDVAGNETKAGANVTFTVSKTGTATIMYDNELVTDTLTIKEGKSGGKLEITSDGNEATITLSRSSNNSVLTVNPHD